MHHLQVIHGWCQEQHGVDRLLVIRFDPDGRQPMFRKFHASNKEPMWKPTEFFLPKFQKVCGATIAPYIALLLNEPSKVEELFAPSVNGTLVHTVGFE